MKSTGVVRKLDNLGRVVIPVELRRTMGMLDENDNPTDVAMEFFVEGERIILQKYAPGCTFCGRSEIAKVHNRKLICQSCLDELK